MLLFSTLPLVAWRSSYLASSETPTYLSPLLSELSVFFYSFKHTITLNILKILNSMSPSSNYPNFLFPLWKTQVFKFVFSSVLFPILILSPPVSFSSTTLPQLLLRSPLTFSLPNPVSILSSSYSTSQKCFTWITFFIQLLGYYILLIILLPHMLPISHMDPHLSDFLFSFFFFRHLPHTPGLHIPQSWYLSLKV